MNNQLLSIKAKKFGVRLSSYRKSKGISLDSLSRWTGISQDEIEKIESGESTLSLPEIEVIALKMGLSTADLVSGEIIPERDAETELALNGQFISLRDRMIALLLHKARSEQNKSLEEIAEKVGISTSELNDYESGAISIPWPVLDFLCSVYELTVSSLLSTPGKTEKDDVQNGGSQAMSASNVDEMSKFINNPANKPYLDLAKRLSELDAGKLRNIAEGLLEITY